MSKQSAFIEQLLQSQKKALQRKVLRRRKALEEAEDALQDLESEIKKAGLDQPGLPGT